MKRFCLFIFCFIFICLSALSSPIGCYAQENDIGDVSDIYYIYDTQKNKIAESSYVEIGDLVITKDLKEYEIVSIDEQNLSAIAEYNGSYEKPQIVDKTTKDNVNLGQQIKKSVGLYMTHNDESYVPTDNVSSVYGQGGIHDIARELKKCFEDLGYEVNLNETLHLPHDSGAYARSSNTAKTLLKNNPDALFDIHRDGVGRSVYVKNINGKERCKVRIVVGQANPNKDANLQFAMYLVSVAEEYCPWLFLDIYAAKGHYNQALFSKGLLFEMGTYMAEKEIVLETVPYLAEVVDKTLFATVVEDDNTLVVSDTVSQSEENLVNNILETNNYTKFNSQYAKNIAIFAGIFIFVCSALAIYLTIKNKQQESKKSLKK